MAHAQCETCGNTYEKAFHVSLDDLLRANSMTRRSVIHAGQTLKIPN